VSRVIKYGGPAPELHFNYRSPFNEIWGQPALQERYAYTARFPDTQSEGLEISLFDAAR